MVITPKQIRLEKSRRNLIDFTTYTFSGYDVNWHHRVCADVLDKWQSGEIPNLMIFMPPRHGKSELVSRRLPAKILGDHPDDTVIFASYASTLAERMNRDTQRIIDSKAYHEIYPATTLSDSMHRAIMGSKQRNVVRNNKMFEIVGHRGAYICAGVGGPITGMGGKWGIIDDPVKNMQEAMSPKKRETVIEWYDSTFDTRLEGNDVRRLITLTRWHPDDLAGQLLRRAKADPLATQWHVLTLPAICHNPKAQYEQRNIGEPLWPDKKNVDSLNSIKASVVPKVWGALYQQNPTSDEGHVWNADYIKPASELSVGIDRIMDEIHSVAYDWDLAYTKKQINSASAYVKAGLWKDKVVILDIGFDWLEYPELISWMSGKKGTHYVEAKASGVSAVQSLRRGGINAMEAKETAGDKIARTNLVTPYGHQGRIYCVDHVRDKLLRDDKQGILQLSDTNDDIDVNDALVQSILRLLGNSYDTDMSELFEDPDLMRGR